MRNVFLMRIAMSSVVDLLVGEAEASLLAISKAMDLQIPRLIIAGDSSMVLESFHLDPLSPILPRKIRSLILKALDLLRWCFIWSIIKIPCDDNAVAQSITAWVAAHSFVGEIPLPFFSVEAFGNSTGP
ncbi:hypothetical protein CJ030_MR1G029331 [Morella rubra]|uniref:RNase H type-1 domain-containing protein n=1 Tax=Morella rubra TaxID=262757 RepID=A0A6A1WTF5_9ROSI|nr:hypothetical protein CJ030_MR1G029331 [Morella rubra]